MFVDKKRERSKERTKILLAHRFVENIRPAKRLANLDMVDIE
jgi:hypothetical protein